MVSRASNNAKPRPACQRTGEPFRRPESYDHLVQNEREFERIVAYIENNPVTAGLANRPEEFAWSSAGVAIAGT